MDNSVQPKSEYLERATLLATIENLKRFLNSGIARRNLRQEDILEVIKTLPAENVAPVVHSRWKNFRKQGIAVCMNCSFERKLDDNFGSAISCHNCGALMDGE